MSISDKMKARRLIDQQREEKEREYYSEKSIRERREKKKIEMKQAADMDYPEISRTIYNNIITTLDDKTAWSLESVYKLKNNDYDYADFILEKLRSDKKFEGVRFGYDSRNHYIEYFFN